MTEASRIDRFFDNVDRQLVRIDDFLAGTNGRREHPWLRLAITGKTRRGIDMSKFKDLTIRGQNAVQEEVDQRLRETNASITQIVTQAGLLAISLGFIVSVPQMDINAAYKITILVLADIAILALIRIIQPKLQEWMKENRISDGIELVDIALSGAREDLDGEELAEFEEKNIRDEVARYSQRRLEHRRKLMRHQRQLLWIAGQCVSVSIILLPFALLSA